MNKILKIAVNGHKMERGGDVAGAAGSHNAVTLALTFDKAWDGTTKTCYFFDANGENPVFRLLTADLLKDGSYWLPIPSEPLVHAGRMTVSVRGVETAGGVCSRVMMAASTLLRVLDAKVPEKDTAPADVTPTQAEQIQRQIDKLLTDLTAQADRAAAGARTATEKAAAAAVSENNAVVASANSSAAAKAATTAKTQAEEAVRSFTTDETARVAAETGRITNETGRVDAETGRKSAETARDTAEKARANETAGIVAQASDKALLAESYAHGGTGILRDPLTLLDAKNIVWDAQKRATAPGGGTMPVEGKTYRITVDGVAYDAAAVSLIPAVRSVGVSPSSATIAPGGTRQFTAVVAAENDAPTTVSWSISGATQPGTTISAGGLLTVGATETGPLTVMATSTFDAAKTGTATITVEGKLAITGVTVDPSCFYYISGTSTKQFAASVSPAGAPQGVTWSLTGATQAGTTLSSSGLLTIAFGERANLVVRATSTDDTTKFDTATVQYSENPPVDPDPPLIPYVDSVSVSPSRAYYFGGTNQREQFTATVLPATASQGVTWSISGATQAGTAISAAGLLTIAAAERANLVIRATSTDDATKFGTATDEYSENPPVDPGPVQAAVRSMRAAPMAAVAPIGYAITAGKVALTYKIAGNVWVLTTTDTAVKSVSARLEQGPPEGADNAKYYAQRAETAGTNAEASQAAALRSQQNAAGSAATAANSAAASNGSKTAAATSEKNAADSASAALASQNAAAGSSAAADASAKGAESAKTAAGISAGAADASATAAAGSAGAAATAKTAAENAKGAAETARTDASASKTAAAGSATSAAQAAQLSVTKSGEAASSATAAANSATAAEASKVAAANAKTAAETAETNAKAAQAAALLSQQSATGSATASANSAAASDGSKTAAATSEKNAADSATAALASKNAAATSAGTATAQAKASTDKATEAKSFAVGGTGTRVGEDTDNAKWYKEQAAAIVGGDYPTKVQAQGYATTAKDTAIAAASADATNKADAAIRTASADATAKADAVDTKLASHAGDTKKHITDAERSAWNAKETTAGAQSKANTARDEAKAASRPNTWVPTAAEVGAAPSSHVGDASHASVAEKNAWNGKAAGNHTHTASQVGAAPANHSHTAGDVGALPTTGGTLTGNLTIKGSGNYGTRINFGDGDYVHISEPSDDKLELKGSNVDIVANSLTKNGGPLLVGFGPVIITVSVGNWSASAPFTQTVSVGGVTSSDTHLHLYPVDIADKAARDLYNKAVGCLAPEADTVSGGVKLTCREKKPETTFQMSLEGARG